ncbi:hypothetical protein JFL54_07265 [Histophilus somni]|nr:hypothetical protein [Histophilus somni]QQF83775.1 hypothetical protein JFL54_07265 [Histophilus somni]
MALGDNASIGKDASSSIALGNNAEATMQNSVALGYQSTTKYFYDLDGYVPEGSSYKIANDNAVGIISVGGWDKQQKVRSVYVV